MININKEVKKKDKGTFESNHHVQGCEATVRVQGWSFKPCPGIMGSRVREAPAL